MSINGEREKLMCVAVSCLWFPSEPVCVSHRNNRKYSVSGSRANKMLTLNCGSQHEILKHAEKSPSLTLRHKLFYAYTEKIVDLSVRPSRVSANVPRLSNTAESRALEESELGVALT